MVRKLVGLAVFVVLLALTPSPAMGMPSEQPEESHRNSALADDAPEEQDPIDLLIRKLDESVAQEENLNPISDADVLESSLKELSSASNGNKHDLLARSVADAADIINGDDGDFEDQLDDESLEEGVDQFAQVEENWEVEDAADDDEDNEKDEDDGQDAAFVVDDEEVHDEDAANEQDELQESKDDEINEVEFDEERELR